MRRRSRRSINALIDELASLSPRAAAERINDDPEVRSLEIARRLIDRSAAARPERPYESANLGSMALYILELLSSEEVGSVAVEASCMLAHVRRRERDLSRAELALQSAAHLVAGPEDSAHHLRSFAILRWDQGRCDEAVGLLIRAERLFRDAGLPREASTTTQLLVLLYAEMGEGPEAIGLFKQLDQAEPTVRPWLSARSALVAAFWLAHLSDLAQPEEALAALAKGISLIPLVQDPDELLELEWLRARSLGRLGHHEEAECILVALRQRLSLAEIRDELTYCLLTLDLIALRKAAGKETQDLFEDLGALPPSTPQMQLSTDAVLLGTDLSEGSDVWGFAGSMRFIILRAFRIHGLPIVPFPFA